MRASREHEEYRFGYMNVRELWRRLDRIRDRSKLLLFADVAMSYYGRTGNREYLSLSEEARRRYNNPNADMHYGVPSPAERTPQFDQDAEEAYQNLCADVENVDAVNAICSDPAFFPDGLTRDENGSLIRLIRLEK